VPAERAARPAVPEREQSAAQPPAEKKPLVRPLRRPAGDKPIIG
jgi:hypothetical protein